MNSKPASLYRRIALWLSMCGLIATLLFSVLACAKSPSTQSSVPTTTAKWSADGIINIDEYANSAIYDNGNFEIYWETDAQYIYIGIKAKTIGWVALGFNTTSNLKNVDYVFGWVTNSKAAVSDEFSADYHGLHQTDKSLGGTDDINDFGGQELDGYTIIEFKRALNTGDAYDANLVPGTISIIWAYGSSDSINTIHQQRGYGQIKI